MKCANFYTHNTVIHCAYVIIYFFKNLALSNDETAIVAIESSLKPMPLRPNYCSMRLFHTGMCSSGRITLMCDIFRMGVVTGYREGMLNLLNLFSLKRLPLLLFYVLHFHVLKFHALHTSPSVSCPAISWLDCDQACKLVHQFHLRRFHVQHSQRPLMGKWLDCDQTCT